MKLTFFCSLLVSLAFPATIATTTALGDLLPAVAWYFLKLIGLIGVIAVWENAWVRLSLRRTPVYLAAALAPIILSIVYNFITGGGLVTAGS
jgi:hypothetical protein